MQLFHRPLSVRLLGLAMLVGTAAGFAFHNELTRSSPAKESTVASPAEIRLWFREKSEPALSSITLIRTSDSSKVALAKVAQTDDPLSIKAAVPVTLAPGGYLVSWRTAGDDGHVIRGSFPFTVGK